MRLREFGALLREAAYTLKRDDGFGLAAEAAYAFALSFFPLLFFLTTLVGLLAQTPQWQHALSSLLAPYLPNETYRFILETLASIHLPHPTLQLAGSLVLSLWAASAVFQVFIKAIMRAYHAPNRRPFWKNRLLSAMFVILAGLGLAGGFLGVVLGPALGRWLERLGLGDEIATLLEVLRYPLALLLITPTLALLYRLAPDTPRHPATAIWPGALLATFLWTLVSSLFSLYVTEFASYNRAYGTLAGLEILLTWMYLTSLAVIAGASFNAVFARWIERQGLSHAT